MKVLKTKREEKVSPGITLTPRLPVNKNYLKSRESSFQIKLSWSPATIFAASLSLLSVLDEGDDSQPVVTEKLGYEQ